VGGVGRGRGWEVGGLGGGEGGFFGVFTRKTNTMVGGKWELGGRGNCSGSRQWGVKVYVSAKRKLQKVCPISGSARGAGLKERRAFERKAEDVGGY